MKIYEVNQLHKTKEEKLQLQLIVEEKLNEIDHGVQIQGEDKIQEEADLISLWKTSTHENIVLDMEERREGAKINQHK